MRVGKSVTSSVTRVPPMIARFAVARCSSLAGHSTCAATASSGIDAQRSTIVRLFQLPYALKYAASDGITSVSPTDAQTRRNFFVRSVARRAT